MIFRAACFPRRPGAAIVTTICYGAGPFALAPDEAMAADPKTAVNGGNRKINPAQPWRVHDSFDLYHVNAWGKGYFSISDSGHVVVRPDTQPGRDIDLFEVVEGLKARDLTTPVVVRFSDILAHRLKSLNAAFAQAIAENDYRNRYTAVYPIKVNQQRLVVEEVYRYGKEFSFGLEAGSKPELLAVMAMTEDSPERMIVCNGFKDDSYIEAVILATKLGRTIIPVIENFEELKLVLRHAYAELKLMGAGVKYIDVGGGLGVDYDGSGTNFESSMNYTMNEYASDVVYRIGSVCNARGIDHPIIVSESGRATAAHHSVLIFNALGSSALDKFRVA